MSSRTRLLYVMQHHDVSGAETLLVPWLRADPDPLMVCPPGTRAEAYFRDLGIPTAPLPYRVLRHSGGRVETLRSVRRGIVSARDLRAVLRAHPERRVVVATSLRPAMLTALAGTGLRRRVLWIVPDFVAPGPVGLATRALAQIGCDLAAPLSQALAADFAGRSHRLAARTEVLYPGVSMERFGPPPDPLPPVAGVLGHVSPTKRTDVALDVAAQVAAGHPEFRVEILGRAQFRDEDFAFERTLHARVEDEAVLRDRVRFAGHVTDVPGALARLGLLLHCRTDEPFGVALIEAMAAGLPVVAPASAGPREIVEDGVTGFLYAPGDAAAAAAAVVRLLADPAAAARMGHAGRERARRLFSAEATTATFERLIARLG